MRKTNLQSLLVIIASVILLSSCSQVRQVTTSSNHKLHLIKADRNKATTATAKAESPKVIEGTELNSLPPKANDLSALQEEKNSVPQLRPVQPSIGKESKSNSKSGFADKKFEQVKKVINRVNAISDLSSSIQSEKKLLPYGHSDASKYLKLWIIFAIGAAVFSIVGVVAASSSVSNGGTGFGAYVIFELLALICWILAVVFFIIWLVKLFS